MLMLVEIVDAKGVFKEKIVGEKSSICPYSEVSWLDAF